MARRCSQPGCTRPCYGRQLCGVHFHRFQRAGTLDQFPRIKVRPDASPLERLQRIGWVEVGACWIWRGMCSKEGYARMSWMVDGRYRYFQAHRVAYEIWRGPIPDDAYLVSICGTPKCIRPEYFTVKDESWHLEDARAAGIARRLTHEEDKPRRYLAQPGSGGRGRHHAAHGQARPDGGPTDAG